MFIWSQLNPILVNFAIQSLGLLKNIHISHNNWQNLFFAPPYLQNYAY